MLSSRGRGRVPCACSCVLVVLLCVLRCPRAVLERFKRLKIKRKRGAKLSKNIFDLFNEQNPKAEQRAVDEKVVMRDPETEKEKVVEKTEPEPEPKSEPETVPTSEPKSEPVPTETKESEVTNNV